MSDFQIGLSGLNAAKNALDIIGNNVANAATEGYHIQRPEFSSIEGIGKAVGSGVQFDGSTRMIDELLEQEILNQNSSLQQVTRQLRSLSAVENSFAELSGEDSGLSTTMDNFFNSISELAANPDQSVWQNTMLSNAKALTQKFRSLGNYFENLNKQIRNEVDNSLESVNNIIAEIAELNDKIERRHLSEKDTNSLKDLRNKYFTELSQFVSVTTENRQNGVVDVVCSSIPVVVGSSALSLKADTTENGKLGVAVEGTYNYYTDIRGGDIGALLSLSNDYIADVEGKIDDLACAITNQINKYHVQGVGSFGSFESISGWKNDSGQLSDFGRISDGSFFIRVKNTQTGIITREEINVDKENDTLSDIAARISNITGLSADVSSENILSINSDSQYEFDFTPALLSEPDTSNLNGNAGSDIPSISVSGIFNGTENTDYTFSVQGAGQTGSTENLQIRIEKDGQFLKNIDIGSGYPVKDSIEVEQGIYISLGAGQVNAGEEFTIKALSDSDTSGLLSAAGMNTFFSAQSASDMKVCSAVQDNPQRIATSITADMTDSENANKMAAVRDEPVQELGFLSVVGFYHRTVTNLGQEINIKEMDQQNLQSMVQNLKNEQSEISGVDINEQAAQLMLFQQMYQGMAKYMVSVRDVTNSLMELV